MKKETYEKVEYEDHVFHQHLFKKTVGHQDRRKYGKLDLFKCIQCGCLKQYDRNTLKSLYYYKDQFLLTPPQCVYDPEMHSEMKKFHLNPPDLKRKRTLDELKD